MKGVVITGATGAIGISLVRYFSSKSIPVLAFVREQSARRKYIEDLPHVMIRDCSLSRLPEFVLDNEINDNAFDVIYHLGWEGSDRDSRNDPDIQAKNIEYTKNVIDLAKRIGCKTFIGAGSQAEFGSVEGVIDETVPSNPVSEYGKAKLKVEQFSREYCSELGIRHIWTRIFSVYGPGMGMDSLITYSIRELMNGKSPKSTKGEQIWDFLYSDDAAEALYLLALKGRDKDVYCISGGEGKMVKEYLEIMRDVINPSVELVFGEVPYSPNQIMELVGDISKLKNDTGFKPEISFEEGIRRMRDWMTGEKL